MFHFLHKIYVLVIWVILVGGGYLAYQWLHEPALDLAQALRGGTGFEQRLQGALTGRVVQVYDGDSFQLLDSRGKFYNLTLSGLQATDAFLSRSDEALRQPATSKAFLAQMLLSNQIRFEVTYSNRPQTCIGLAYLGETNVNVALVAAGAAVPRPSYMNGLPWHLRFNLLRAARQARQDR